MRKYRQLLTGERRSAVDLANLIMPIILDWACEERSKWRKEGYLQAGEVGFKP